MNIYHVTEILRKYVDFSRVPDLRLYEASQRGSIVHRACAAFCSGAYVAPLGEAYQGYFVSFQRWFDAYVKKVVLVEKTFIDSVWGFTGTLDLFCEMSNGVRALIDIKTPIAESHAWRVQLSAYRHLLESNGIETNASIALRLKKDGSEAIATRYPKWKDDFKVFLFALNAHRALIR